MGIHLRRQESEVEQNDAGCKVENQNQVREEGRQEPCIEACGKEGCQEGDSQTSRQEGGQEGSLVAPSRQPNLARDRDLGFKRAASEWSS